MKKSVLCAILMLVVLPVVYLAYPAEVEKISGGYQFTIKVDNGWNLIPTPGFTSIWNMAPQSARNIENSYKAGFVYLPMEKNYVNIKGGASEDDDKDILDNSDYLGLSAAWMYFDKDSEVSYS